MDLGEPIRRGTMVPEDEPIRAPEPATKPVPRREIAPVRREREKEPA
jgi:hypothetical protein